MFIILIVNLASGQISNLHKITRWQDHPEYHHPEETLINSIKYDYSDWKPIVPHYYKRTYRKNLTEYGYPYVLPVPGFYGDGGYNEMEEPNTEKSYPTSEDPFKRDKIWEKEAYSYFETGIQDRQDLGGFSSLASISIPPV